MLNTADLVEKPQETELQRSVNTYIQLRDERARIKAEFEAKDRELLGAMERLEHAWLQIMNKTGMTALPVDGASVQRRVKHLYACGDWAAFYAWMISRNRPDLLQKRLAEGSLNELRDNGADLPPGVTYSSEYKVVVTRK